VEAMNQSLEKIGFGGGCHWCTEAIFQSLRGVEQVEQGWIASTEENETFSEAIIVHFRATVISLETLVKIHLYTHSCTANHSMRKKYRSAVYTFSAVQALLVENTLSVLQKEFDNSIITQVLPFVRFKENEASFLDYYYSNPSKPFCQNVINPKLRLLLKHFSSEINQNKLNHL